MACRLDVEKTVTGEIQRRIKNISPIENFYASVTKDFGKTDIQEISNLNKQFGEKVITYTPSSYSDLPGNIFIHISDNLYDAYIKAIDKERSKSFKRDINYFQDKELLEQEQRDFRLDDVDFYREHSQYDPKYSFLDEPFIPSTEESSNTYAIEVLKRLAGALSSKFAINYEFITAKDAAELLAKQGVTYNGERGFFVGDTAYFVGENLNAKIIFHEFAHPVFRAMQLENPELFESLYTRLSASKEGMAIIDTVKKLYPKLKETDNKFREEVMVRALTQTMNTDAITPQYKTALGEIWFNIKQFFRRFFKGTRINIQDLNSETTLEEFAKMIESENFKIDSEIFTESDFVAFVKETRQELVTEAQKIETSDLIKITDAFFEKIKRQQAMLSSLKYKEVRSVLTDKLDRSDLTEILSNLRYFNSVNTPEFKDTNQEIEYYKKQAENLINSLLRLESAAERMASHFKELAKKDINDKETLAKIFYYDQIIRDWSEFLNEIDKAVNNENYSDKFKSDNPLYNLFNSIKTTLGRTKSFRDRVYTEGVKDLLVSQLEPMRQNIDKHFEDKIEYKKSKNAPKAEIDKLVAQYEKLRLTPDKIQQLLKGELDDADQFWSFMEGYIYNQDPIIFGFSQYVKDNFIEVITETQKRMTDYFNKMNPLLAAAGYDNPAARILMGRELTSEDNRDYTNDGKFKVFRTFLNPWKNYKGEIKKLQKQIDKTKEQYLLNRTKETQLEYVKAIKAMSDHDRKYMNQPYHSSFYELKELFDDEIGTMAMEAQREIISQIQGNSSTYDSIEELIEGSDRERELWRKYTQLASPYYDDGSPKVDDPANFVFDKSIAERLKEYRSRSRKFYEWKPKKGAFNAAYLNYLHSLEVEGLSQDQIDIKLAEWVKKNTVLKLSDAFYASKADIMNRLSKLSTTPKDQEILRLFEKITNYISSFKDENGHPIGSEMKDELLQKIKEAEQEISNIRSNNVIGSLTDAEEMRKQELQTRLGKDLTEDEMDELSELLDKERNLKSGKNPNAKEIALLIKELFDLQNRVPTQNYIDKVNGFLTKEMKDFLDIDGFDESNISALTDESIVEELCSMSESFKRWFLNNHIKSSYVSKKQKRKITKYTASRAWSTIVPKDPKHYVKTIIFDETGTQVLDSIQGVPNRTFNYRVVKDSYTNENGETIKLKTERITMLDCIEKGLPITEATIDMHGDWLPKMSPGNPYINDEYFALMKNSPKKFAVLQGLIQFHLETQKDLPYDSRLDLEIARYRIESFETVLNTTNKQNPLSVWWGKVKAYFSKQPDDLEEGLNPDTTKMIVVSDMYDENYTKVPITGIYDLDLEQTSLDLMTGSLRYLQSGLKQRKLLDMLPYAKALQTVVNDPNNNHQKMQNSLKVFQKARTKITDLLTPVKSKGMSFRARAVNNFIEREFEGKQLTGMLSDSGFINKFAGSLQRNAGHKFFAFNIPSALKNSLGLRFQSLIESASGKNFSFSDYTRGSIWAQGVTMDISFNIYRHAPKSINYQLVELMDPSQGRLEKKIREGTGASRSLASDITELTFLTNVRKWTELNSTLSIFGAMLINEKIKRTLSNGEVQLISYNDAWEVVDGNIQLKSGIDPEYGKNGIKFKQFVRKVHGVTNNLAGAYANFDQPEANRYLLYKMLMSMKTYFMRMFLNRFGGTSFKFKKGFELEYRYDALSDDVRRGYYSEAIKLIADTLKYRGKNLQSMDDEQKQALKKALTEGVLLYIVGGLFINLIFGFDGDDEDKYNKLRAKSGAAPLPFVTEDPDNPFKLGGWLANHGLYLAMLVKSENEAWVPVPGMGFDDYSNILSVQSVPLKATILSYASTLNHFANWGSYIITGETNSGFYKREVGPYEWQDEGGAKFLNYLMKDVFTLTGTTVDPVLGIKQQQSIQIKE